MELDYDYQKIVSTNPSDKGPLSSDDEDEPNTWSPSSDDDSPTVTVTIVPGDDPEDTFINSIKIVSTEGVEEVTVVIIKEDGDRVSSIKTKQQFMNVFT